MTDATAVDSARADDTHHFSPIVPLIYVSTFKFSPSVLTRTVPCSPVVKTYAPASRPHARISGPAGTARPPATSSARRSPLGVALGDRQVAPAGAGLAEGEEVGHTTPPVLVVEALNPPRLSRDGGARLGDELLALLVDVDHRA